VNDRSYIPDLIQRCFQTN